MAIVNRQEFADMCGDDVKLLNVYISRSKVVTCDESGAVARDNKGKYIDTKNTVNKGYLDKRKHANKQKREEQSVIKQIPKAVKYTSATKESDDDDDDEDDDMPEQLPRTVLQSFVANEVNGPPLADPIEGSTNWIMVKIKGDAQLVTLKVEKEKLLLDKAAGKLVPVSIVHDINRGMVRAITSSFESSIENIASMFCNIMAGGDMAMYARITEEARKELQAAIGKAGASSEDEIRNVIDAYADTKATRL